MEIENSRLKPYAQLCGHIHAIKLQLNVTEKLIQELMKDNLNLEDEHANSLIYAIQKTHIELEKNLDEKNGL